jgi:hypothetical protein
MVPNSGAAESTVSLLSLIAECPMRRLLSTLSTIAFLAHMTLGCCWHHAHGPAHQSPDEHVHLGSLTVRHDHDHAPADDGCHDDDCHNDGDRSDPARRSCTDPTCAAVATKPSEAPRAAIAYDEPMVAQMVAVAVPARPREVSRWNLAIHLTLRPHLANSVLLL